jgi:hypothetical protein
MTILALDTAVSSELKHGKMFSESNGPLAPQSSSQTWSLPHRVNLRKRPCSTKKMNLQSVNSAFLSGLFADVANVVEESSYPEQESSFHSPKKSRISKTKSMSRCGQSYMVLTAMGDEACGVRILDSPLMENTLSLGHDLLFNREDSLQFQLDCVSSSTDVTSAMSIAFPQLPASVSNSSCGTTLTRVISDLQSSFTEKSAEKDSYGWFVEMEDDVSTNEIPLAVSDPYASKSSQDLAFSAHTAPKAENYDAELEWATAADTVDDVLGDFF